MINISARYRAATLAVLAGAGFASLALAGPAGATTGQPFAGLKTVKIVAACTTNPGGAGSYKASVTTNAPGTVTPGTTVKLTQVQYKVTVPGSLVTEAINFGFNSASGTVKTLDINSSDVHTKTGVQNIAKKPFNFGPIPLTKAEETTGVTVSLPKTATTLSGWVANAKGTMNFTQGSVLIDATFSGGGSTFPVTLSCTPGKTVVNTTAVS